MSWWKKVWRRRFQEGELDAELRFHMDEQVRNHVKAGMPAAEARRIVRLEFGDLELVKDECRDVRPLSWAGDLARDTRLGLRRLGRDRGFAASVAAILGLGIGVSVAMFSVLNAVVLRPLPYESPGELVTVNTHDIAAGQWDGSSVPNFLDWRAQAKSFAGMTCYGRTQVSQVTFAGVDEPQRAQEGLACPGFFELLGTAPVIGRVFTREELERGDPVVVLSEGLWQERFGRSETAIGRTLTIGGVEHVVIGAMPGSFQLPRSDTRFWRPLTRARPWARISDERARDGDLIEVLGRLAPGVRVEEAQAEMAVIAERLRREHAVNRNRDARVVPLFEHVVGVRTSRGVWMGFAAVMVLLAIACANVGGLLMTRAAGRRHELAVRSALGAERLRLVRQLLAESVCLWGIASAGGVLLAQALVRMLVAYGPGTLPRLEEVGLDGTALAAAFGGGLVVVLISGTVPALFAAKADASEAFGVRSRVRGGRGGMQDLLIVGQIGGSLLLVVVAVLFAQSFLHAQKEDAGYSGENLLVVRIERPTVAGFFGEARERIGRLPGVIAVGGIKQFFLRRNPDQRVTVEGRPNASRESAPRLAVDAVTPGYFRSMGIEVVEGRDFEDRDMAEGARVSVVNETMARRFWPGESAIGKRWTGGDAPPKGGDWTTVAGVVKDMRREGLDVAPIAAAFVPDQFSGNFDLTVRTSVDAEGLIGAIRREIRSVDASLPIPEIEPANMRLMERLGGRRFESQLLAGFAVIALLLSAAGLYASLAYQVVSRTREIGIRSAMGARRGAIISMVVWRGLRLAAMGSALGVCGAVSAAKAMQSLLYKTPAVSAGSYAGAAAVVALVAMAAAWIPARRAAAISPMEALREE